MKEFDPNDDQDLDAAWSSRGWPALSIKERVGSTLKAKLFKMAVSEPVKFEIIP